MLNPAFKPAYSAQAGTQVMRASAKNSATPQDAKMPRISRKASSTKEKLLEAAQHLMLEKGFTATTVDDICEAAGLTKGSFFHYFKSKEDLGQEVLTHFFNCMQQTIQQAPFLKKGDPLKRVYEYVDFMIRMYLDPLSPTSCLVGNFAQELSNSHSKIRASCNRMFSQWVNGLKGDLKAARSRYAPKKSIDVESLAEHFIAVTEGALILAKAKQDRAIIKKNLLHYKRYLKSLFEK